MNEADVAMKTLQPDETWHLLARASLGRLAVSVAGEPDIFPVNYAVQEKTILLHTAPGSKLLEVTINSKVAFEVDAVAPTSAWSVVVRGHCVALHDEDEIFAAFEADVPSWTRTAKSVYLRITPTELEGRIFQFGDEPEFDWAS